MCDDNKDIKFSLTVMLNKEENKVLYAVADNHFADILLSFLTLPSGRIVKVLEKHYGEEAPTFGSVSSLYHGLANLDSSHFVTEGAKKILLHLISSFEAEHEMLKLDITDSPPAEYFVCRKCSWISSRNVSVYYDKISSYCKYCKVYGTTSKEVHKKMSEAASGDGVLTVHSASFIISDDLKILPNESGFSRIISILGITDTDKAEPVVVDFGLSEIMNLLKASLFSPTPLSDVILKKTTKMMNSPILQSQPMIAKECNPNCDFILRVMIQKSTGKLLYAEAKEKFIEFLCSLLIILVGGVEHLLAEKNCIKAINNLHRSTADLIDDQYFKTTTTKSRLMSLNLPHGYISKNYLLPLTEEPLPDNYTDNLWSFSSVNFPKGQGSYLKEPRTYEVKDDLTVTPFCFISVFSSLREQKIRISDVKEVELQIGLKEGLSILKASLTSTYALTDALLSQTSNKQPKIEV